MFRRRGRIEVKNEAQLAHMRAAGLVVARALGEMVDAVAPGVTTADLDGIARSILAQEGARSSFLGYHGFPAVVCVSVNDEVVHGIPGPRRLGEGDLVSIDFGAIVEGWHGDAAVSVPVGEVSAEVAHLSRITEDALWAGLAAALVGGRLTDVGHAVERTVRAAGDYGIVEEYVGHGIGSEMHMEPSVPNYGAPGQGPRLEAGMALAVEPMVMLGERYVHLLDDGWTVVTSDSSTAAHWEHTVALTPAGPWVLTAVDGGAERFAAMGVASPAVAG